MEVEINKSVVGWTFLRNSSFCESDDILVKIIASILNDSRCYIEIKNERKQKHLEKNIWLVKFQETIYSENVEKFKKNMDLILTQQKTT